MTQTYGTAIRTFQNGTVQNISNIPKSQIIDSKTLIQGDHKTPLPYTRTYSKVDYWTGSMNWIGLYDYTGCLYYECPLQWVDPALTSEQMAELENRCLSKVVNQLRSRDDNSGHDLLVSLFESPELVSLQKQISEILHNIRRMKINKLLRKAAPTVVAAEFYLLWTFGISPLIGALNELISTLDSGIKTYEKVKGTAQETNSGSNYYFNADVYNAGVISAGSHMVRLSYGADVSIDDLTQIIKGQFGLTTPVASAYAVLPMSFILDWFINIGSYLDTMEYLMNPSGYNINNIYESRLVRKMFERSCIGLFKHKHGYWIDYDCKCSYEEISFVRSLHSELPKPHLPTFSPQLNGGKITSLFAIARTALFS